MPSLLHAPALHACEKAVAVVRAHPELAQDVTHGYVLALFDRELAVLELSEAMLVQEGEDAARDLQRCEDSLKRNKQARRMSHVGSCISFPVGSRVVQR